jgi:hypothetical protein
VVFTNGINARKLLDSISLGFAKTVDIMWHEKGRVGQEPETVARGVVLVQLSSISAAIKQVEGSFQFLSLTCVLTFIRPCQSSKSASQAVQGRNSQETSRPDGGSQGAVSSREKVLLRISQQTLWKSTSGTHHSRLRRG